MPSLYFYIFIYMLSFFIVMSSDDWFVIWMGLEINMMSFIIIVYKRLDKGCVESCMKYFFVQGLGSAVFLGAFYLNMFFMGELLVMILGYSIGAAPFYYWFPSVCSGLSWSSCFMLLSFQKVMPIMLMVMILSWVIWFMIIFSLMVGAWGSFNQSNLKNLMAYSSIHHLGWIFLCNLFNDEVWFMYLVLYCMMIISVILVLMNDEIIYLSYIDGWKNKMWFAFGMLSMGGMPPMLGFFLKWMAFLYIMKMNLLLIMMMVMLSVLMFYVYFRIVFDVYMYGNMNLGYMDNYKNVLYIYMVDVVSVVGLLMGIGVILFF